MNYYKQRIKDNQKFLLELLNLHIGGYFPLRKWLGIDFRGQIDNISHLSYGYNTKFFKKGKQWYQTQTRVYQQPDLGYKLNLILDSIPEVLVPKYTQPSWGLLQMRLARCTTTTYQPTTNDTYLRYDYPNNNYGTDSFLICYGRYSGNTYHDNVLLHWNTSDIPNGSTFTAATISLYKPDTWGYNYDHYLHAYRLTQTAWTETGATFNKYDGTYTWTSAGGDYTTNNGVQSSLSHGNTAEWITWSNAQTLIQDCFDNQSKHVHILLRNDNETSTEMASRFYSCEYTTNTSLRPKLVVTYTAPSADNSVFFGCNF